MTLHPGLIVAALAALTAGQGSLRQLNSNEIASSLGGKLVAYSPPGWNDAGIQEEFRENGRWAGTRYGRGPLPFVGRWRVRMDQLCVHSERGLSGDQWKRWVCRRVWKDASGKLFMPHLTIGLAPEMRVGLMALSVQQLTK